MKTKVMVILLMAMSSAIFAQQATTPKSEKHGKHSDRFKTELSLTDAQYAKVKDVRSKYAKEYARIYKDDAMTQGEAKKQRTALRQAQENEMKGILSADQWTRYQDMKKKHGEYHRDHKKG